MIISYSGRELRDSALSEYIGKLSFELINLEVLINVLSILNSCNNLEEFCLLFQKKISFEKIDLILEINKLGVVSENGK